MIKKFLSTLAILVILLTNIPSVYGACVIDRVRMSYTIVHEFVDVDCNGTIDIVQEYQLINGIWTPTRWWYY